MICRQRPLVNSINRVLKLAALMTSLFPIAMFAQNPVPQIVGPVKPTAVAPGSGTFTLTVYGANFVPGAVVNWNYQPRTTTFVSARELQAQILAADIRQNTAGFITVTNPAPGGGSSSSSYAQVEVHKPTAGIVANRPNFYLEDSLTEVVGDLSGNGKLDIMAFGLNGLDLLMGNGNGTFQLTNTGGPNAYGIGGIAYGDFNGDGIEDVVYVSGTSTAQLTVMLGEGNGQYHLGSTFGSFASAIAVGDFNGDGKLDIATIDGSINVYLGNGDGTFQEVQTQNVGGAAIMAGDFNGDGKLDLAVWSDTLNNTAFVLALLIGNGDGTFQPANAVTGSANAKTCQSLLTVTDFNGDGNLDLAFCNSSQVGVLLGNGDGTFKRPTFWAAGYGRAFSIAAGDFNSDGKVDLVASHCSFDVQFWTLLGNGDGTFRPKQVIKYLPGAYSGELGIEPGDFNQDGLLDFDLQPPNGGAVVYTQHW